MIDVLFVDKFDEEFIVYCRRIIQVYGRCIFKVVIH